MAAQTTVIEQILITINSPDRPGVIQSVSQAVREQGGNWTESSFTALEGLFVGVVKIEIAEEKKHQLIQALNALSSKAINVQYHESTDTPVTASEQVSTVTLKLEANDREGIIEEITTALASANINIVDLESRCESASMAGYNLFQAEIMVSLPASQTRQDLVDLLEHISDDVMVAVAEA